MRVFYDAYTSLNVSTTVYLMQSLDSKHLSAYCVSVTESKSSFAQKGRYFAIGQTCLICHISSAFLLAMWYLMLTHCIISCALLCYNWPAWSLFEHYFIYNLLGVKNHFRFRFHDLDQHTLSKCDYAVCLSFHFDMTFNRYISILYSWKRNH